MLTCLTCFTCLFEVRVIANDEAAKRRAAGRHAVIGANVWAESHIIGHAVGPEEEALRRRRQLIALALAQRGAHIDRRAAHMNLVTVRARANVRVGVGPRVEVGVGVGGGGRAGVGGAWDMGLGLGLGLYVMSYEEQHRFRASTF